MRSRPAPTALAAILLLCFASGVGRSADAPDASDPPRTEGPLVSLSTPCEDDGPPGPREAKAQTCGWSYSLAPVESDVDEDFSVDWIQMEIDPGKLGCAKELSFYMSAPTGGRIVSASPDHSYRIDKYDNNLASIVVDGDGTAPIPGQVSQDVMPAPGRVTVKMTESSYRYRWTGNSREKVVLAVGVQTSHRMVPPQLIYSQGGGGGFGMGSCKPVVVRVRAK